MGRTSPRVQCQQAPDSGTLCFARKSDGPCERASDRFRIRPLPPFLKFRFLHARSFRCKSKVVATAEAVQSRKTYLKNVTLNIPLHVYKKCPSKRGQSVRLRKTCEAYVCLFWSLCTAIKGLDDYTAICPLGLREKKQAAIMAAC